MKKASELSVLCNADVGVIVFSCTGRLYEFGSSSISQILRRYNTVNGPALLQAQPDPSASHLLAQQAEEIRSLSEEVKRLREEQAEEIRSLREDEAEEIRSLREEVKRLESENLSLVKDLEQQLSNSQPVCYENANLETTLTLRPPSSNADLRMEILELPKMESGSTNSMSQMEM